VIKKRPMNADGKELERRRSQRFPVIVPIEVSWRGLDGLALKEDAVAHQVNDKGGFLRMSKYPGLGTRVTLVNILSAQTAEARVLAAPDSRPGVASGIVVELVVPSENFWGVDLQINKTVFELQNLDKALKGEDIDLRLVREYRDAMDAICSITETLRRLRTSTPQSVNDQELLSVLATDRIRRAISVCQDVVADLDAGRLQPDSVHVEGLTETIQNLHRRLRANITLRQSK
jgi:hypothetical protein